MQMILFIPNTLEFDLFAINTATTAIATIVSLAVKGFFLHPFLHGRNREVYSVIAPDAAVRSWLSDVDIVAAVLQV